MRGSYNWFYDNIYSRCYDLLMKWCFLPLGGESRARQALASAAGVQRGGRVLDMCCGTGSTTFAIAKEAGEGAEIKGVDRSSGQIRVARGRNRSPHIVFAVTDASATSFPEGEFDNVVIPHALHEMPRDGRIAVLREARRVLRYGGTLAVMEMDTPSSWLWRLCIGFFWFYWLPFNFETTTRKDMLRHGLTEEVREAGFDSICKIRMYRGALQVVVAQRPNVDD